MSSIDRSKKGKKTDASISVFEEKELETPFTVDSDEIIYFPVKDIDSSYLKETLEIMNEAIQINTDNIEKEESEWSEIIGILQKEKSEKPKRSLGRNFNHNCRKSSNVGKVIFDNETMASSKLSIGEKETRK